ncbi:dipeptide ABC transporter ATP-binding protein [Arcanobacterium canis]
MAATESLTRISGAWADRLPFVKSVRRSHGIQRGMLVAGLIVTGLMLLMAIFAPLIAPYSLAQQGDANGPFGSLQPPSARNWWGTTVSGFDVFSRVIWGSQTALGVIVLAVAASCVIGVVLGLVSGYLGGWVDRVAVVIADAVYAFPSLLLAIVLSIVISGGQSSAIGGTVAAAGSIAVVFIPQYFRVIRAEAVRLKSEPFVQSAKVLGVPAPTIMLRHVLRNATRTLPLIVTLNCSEAILTLAGLGFIGFGIEPTAAAEWGYDLNRSLADVTSGIWWTSLFPGAAIVLAVLGITLVGESLNDLADPRLRTRRAGRASTLSTDIVAPTSADESRLKVTDLSVTFPTDDGHVQAVRHVSLSIAPGEILALVGESGSGKSVTSRAILSLLPSGAVASGAIVIDGDNVVGLRGEKLRQLRGGKAAMVFQEPSASLNPVFPIWWQMGEGLRAHNGTISRKEIKEQTIRALETVGIDDAEHAMNRYPHEFSGGQKQRIMIAMALAMGAKLIIADEPTTALDVTVQGEILDLLRDIRDRYNTSILLITHNMGVVADLADSVAVMRNGEIIEHDRVGELFARPEQPYTRDLLASVPRLGQHVTEANVVPPAADHGDQQPIVAAQGLKVTYPGRLGAPDFQAVRGVDFSIAPSEVFGLVGESGSGKSTIGRAIAGLEEVTGGSLRVFDTEMRGVKERDFRPLRKDIGFVFQDPSLSLNPQLTIGDAIGEPMAVHRADMSEADHQRRVNELLEAVRLPASFAKRFPHELSGGQRQRVSFARALALEPRLVIADEPTSALDVSVQATVLELFTQLQREYGFACVFITHDLAVVDIVADRIGVLHRGQMVESGSSTQILHDPRHPYTRKLIASLPVPDPAEQARRRAMRTSSREAL